MSDDFDETKGRAEEAPPAVNLRKSDSDDTAGVPTARVSLHKQTEPVDATTPHVNLRKPHFDLQKQEPPTYGEHPQAAPTTATGYAPAREYPPTPPAPYPYPPQTRNRSAAVKIVGTAAAAIAVILLGVVVGTSLSDDLSPSTTSGGPSRSGGSPSGGSAQAAEPCSLPPDIQVRSVTMRNGGLSVVTELSANCADGDVLTDPSFGLTISDGATDVAAGTFDVRSDPIVIPPGGTAEREFVFPNGMYWRIPDVMSSSGSGLDVVATEASAATASGGAVSDGGTTLTASGELPPAHGSPDDAALATLNDLVVSDRSYVAQNLADRWIPQISSKRPGLVADGITWAPAEILREHLALRQRYDDVRLLWSGEWNTFSEPDWWVTVVGIPSREPESALKWCVSAQLDADHCYAKIVSTTRGTDGTTKLQKR